MLLNQHWNSNGFPFYMLKTCNFLYRIQENISSTLQNLESPTQKFARTSRRYEEWDDILFHKKQEKGGTKNFLAILESVKYTTL